jgi:hypothetical protein
MKVPTFSFGRRADHVRMLPDPTHIKITTKQLTDLIYSKKIKKVK